MVIGAPVSFEQVVADWIRAEYGSPFTQVSEAFNGEDAPVEWALQPDVSDAEQNGVRRGVLEMFRPMIRGIPRDTQWLTAQLTRGELAETMYMAGADWEQLTEGSRLVGDGANGASRGLAADDLLDAVRAIRRKVLRGVVFPPLIAVTNPAFHPIVLIEGMKRATAVLYGRRQTNPFVDIRLGVSPNLARFPYW